MSEETLAQESFPVLLESTFGGMNLTGCSKDPIIEAERRRKLSEARTGKKLSEEHKRNMSVSRERFRNSPEFVEYCKHMSETLKGVPKPKPKTEGYKITSSEAAKKRWQDPEYRDKTIKGMVEKRSTPEYCNLRSKISKKQMENPEARKRVGDANRGRSPSSKARALLSARSRGENNPMYGVHLTREMNPSWKGGISFEPYCPKFNREFKERVRAYFGYQCIECGTPQNGKKLGVHHVNFDKMSCCNDVVPLFVPLCNSCHAKSNFNRPYWEQHFTELIDGYYGGKCYFSQEEMRAIKGL